MTAIERLAVRRASDRREHAEALEELRDRAAELDLALGAQVAAEELYLEEVPVSERSRPAVLATCCYTAGLVTGNERPQTEVAEAFGVSRIVIQSRWRDQLRRLGLTPPSW